MVAVFQGYMEFQATEFEGLYEITPTIYRDNRGYFLETFKAQALENMGLRSDFVQDNQSFSLKNVIRGLHLQVEPDEQIKLVRAVSGIVLDVVVDLRKGSNNFGKHYKCILDGKKGNMLYIPAGFAHGIAVIEDAVFSYKCSSYFNKSAEDGILYNDPELDIDWEVENSILSDKDMLLTTFQDFIRKYDLV